ncbi:cyclase family protein [Rhodovibrio salinarum]|uniref:Cyclase n=1 Tax=Rhodovibrio salinarum TaxID=1087 RepID=A0A934QNH8_9PROT|nr:cyclase family protein [Rhodovibrio salinarum]MBK1699324.1 cyclase [Rhodovibrio salinarum]
MCAPGCLETVHHRLSRRNFFKGAGATAAAGALAAAYPPRPAAAQPRSFERVVDMTHTMSPEFPTFFNKPGIELERMARIENDGYNMYRWSLIEHAGTHLDAPIHFSREDQHTAEQIPAEQLVAPLVVVDIKARAAESPDARLTPDDLKAWEAQYGPIPDGAAVAMNSGWDQHAYTEKFVGRDDDGGMHFPGIHAEATQYLLEETGAQGLMVDTLSLDYGQSTSFDTHYAWLPTNRWGLENLKNLDQVPASGATVVIGAPKVQDATGGLTRVLALV